MAFLVVFEFWNERQFFVQLDVDGSFIVESLDVFSVARGVHLQAHEPVVDEVEAVFNCRLGQGLSGVLQGGVVINE